MAVQNDLPCRRPGCASVATRHVQYKQGRSYVKSHFCDGHALAEASAFERTLGVMTETQPVTNACRRNRC